MSEGTQLAMPPVWIPNRMIQVFSAGYGEMHSAHWTYRSRHFLKPHFEHFQGINRLTETQHGKSATCFMLGMILSRLEGKHASCRFSTARAIEPYATDVAFVSALLALQFMLFATCRKKWRNRDSRASESHDVP